MNDFAEQITYEATRIWTGEHCLIDLADELRHHSGMADVEQTRFLQAVQRLLDHCAKHPSEAPKRS